MADGGTTKRRKPAEQQLLPGLPDDLAHLCLSRLPARLLYSVCSSWRRLIYSPSFPPFLSLYALLSSAPTRATAHRSDLGFFSFDPISTMWQPLPTPPPNPPLRLLQLRHPYFIAHHLPIQSVSVAGNILLIAATTHPLLPALSQPLIFDTASCQWRMGPPLSAPRRWCVAGAARGVIYVASGVGSEYNPVVARSAERWDLKSPGRWKKLAPMKDGKFSRESVEAVGSRGKLCMVNVKGKAAKEGAIYDVEGNRWEEMPEGMLAGWNGPAAAMEEEAIYVVDEMTGQLKQYSWEKDTWMVVMESADLKGAVQIAAGGSRVCAVRAGGAGIAVVDVVAKPARIWVVEPPAEMDVVGIHVLPRMRRLEF